VEGYAKDIILKGLGDVCFVIVSDIWLWRGQILSRIRTGTTLRGSLRSPFAFAQGKQGKQDKGVVPIRVFFFLVNNNVPYPWFFVSVADKGVKSEGQSLENKNASRDAGATGYATELPKRYYTLGDTFCQEERPKKLGIGATVKSRRKSQNTHPYKTRVGHPGKRTEKTL
jgi:hypothetical protein